MAQILLLALIFVTANIAAASEPLINGGMISAAISSPGEQDVYTYSANAGENVQIRIADTSGTSFYPRITLYDPSGAYVTYGQGAYVGAISHKATLSGTHTVVVSDVSTGNASTGNYNIYFVHMPGANGNGGLINGGVRSEAIDLGDLDSYTYSANAGENVQIRIADTSGSNFYPRITLYDPSGAYITYGQGANVGVISHKATTNGTYTIVVSDVSTGKAATGFYNLYFVHMPGANEGGTLINGGVVSETIDLGDLDSYTYSANAGENVQIRITDTSGNNFYPRITLYDPSGAYITYGQGANVGVISHKATTNGTYTVVVSDVSTGKAATGFYNIYFVHMPGANEGGSLINGGVVSDTIDMGDLDSYTYTVNAGEDMQLRVVDTSSTNFYPRITLYDPNGAYITYGQGADVGVLSYKASLSGTYTVVVSDVSTGNASTGNYNLYFVHAPGANEGGSLINGGVVSETIDLGDLDSYTYSANAGENVQIRITDTSGTNFYPRITLYDPNGAYITYGQGANVGVISHKATTNGTYTVVVSDVSTGNTATGTYNLYFVHMPGANEGGSLINGGMVSETIDMGDLDSYTYTANAGENVQMRITNTSGSTFYPRMTLYDPSGAYVTYGQGANVGVIRHKATINGTYTVVVSDVSTGNASTGNFNLYFVRAPGANEGGSLINGGVVSETIDRGDLDSYTYSANAGENVQLRIADTSGSNFYPRITLYDPNGKYITYGQGAKVGVISYKATLSGTYTVVVSDVSTGNAATGSYNIYFVQMPGANEGGRLGKGSVVSSAIVLGDLDSYTYSTIAGVPVQIQITDTSGSNFYPRITLYSPNGAYVTYGQGANVGVINYTSTLSGTYTIVVSDVSTGNAATGNYSLTIK